LSSQPQISGRLLLPGLRFSRFWKQGTMAAYTVGNSWLVVIPIPAEIDTANVRDVRCQLTAPPSSPASGS
jgi:hypothetical protein